MGLKDITKKAEESLERNFKDASYKEDDKTEFDGAATANEVETLKEDEMKREASLKEERDELEEAAKAKLDATNKDASYKADDKSAYNAQRVKEEVKDLKENAMNTMESLGKTANALKDVAKDKLDSVTKDAKYTSDDKSLFNSEKVQQQVDVLKENAINASEALSKKAGELRDVAKDKLDSVTKDAKYIADDKSLFNSEKVQEQVQDLKENAINLAESLGKTAQVIKEEAKEKYGSTNKDATYKADDNSYEKLTENEEKFKEDLNKKLNK